MTEWYGLGLLVIVSILTGFGHICFKLVAIRRLSLREKLLAPKFIAGTACFLLGPVLAIVAAKFVDFSLLYAMTALNFVFILLFSRSILNEAVDQRKLLGVGCIIVGLVVIALGKT